MARRKFTRKGQGKSHYKRLFIISPEGSTTEPQYFKLLNQLSAPEFVINCLINKKSSPNKILKKMIDELQKTSLKKGDEAWIVIDKDNWTDDQLNSLYQWSKKSETNGLAVSNPKFEYWLLLHFENGCQGTQPSTCCSRLLAHIPNYSKHIDSKLFTIDSIKYAIHNAKLRDSPPCSDWPKFQGATTVYKLVEKLFN
ncbi:MAG: RloB domain-containing protein [Magnetococcales bacterium]|nr:RloB domain-containing protein [Magnetococcales bacterium]